MTECKVNFTIGLMQIEIEFFSHNLRNLREEREMTQESLARILGISRQSIISLERGRCLPSLPLAIHFAEVFDLALEDILRPAEESMLENETQIAPATNEMRERENDWLLQVKLPENIDHNKIEAEVKDGILMVTLPKISRSLTKIIKIPVKGK